jgi:uncharacterized membrane protein YeaQ/YmgE (transglycosylase-associated protein family)
MNIISLIIEAISGAVGGNVAGAAMKENSLGTMGNSIAGIVGGGLGGTLLQTVMGTAAAGGGSLDLTPSLVMSPAVGWAAPSSWPLLASSRTRWRQSSHGYKSHTDFELKLSRVQSAGARTRLSADKPETTVTIEAKTPNLPANHERLELHGAFLSPAERNP